MDRNIKKMLFIFLIASLFNLFTLELLVDQRLNYINQANDMSAIMVAYNSSGGAIEGSTTACGNKLDCLQKMCIMKQLNLFNSMIIYPRPGSWSDKCDLNVTDSIHKLFKEWRVTCSTVLVSNLLILIVLFIVWIARFCGRLSWHIMSLFTFPLFLLSIGSIVVLSIQLLDSSSEIITGADHYNRIHNIIVLSVYLLFMFLFLIKTIWSLILEHNKPKETEYNNLS